ncbi:pilus assembly protein TadG-related protein [Streptomyces sp. NPDC048196]|uniref:pilus assembly protein TadG-related protein n=1 Tax=Streptomyces sp. NPDC048196 TaxID=3154712 RepID=UPI0033D35F34
MTVAEPRRGARDAGQAFPLYLVAVAGLLFLALAFFAVGQAAATRNGAQTAADAAALAAGQKYRDLLTKRVLDGVRDGSYETDKAAWEDLLNGRGVLSPAACASADWFAGRNDAEVSRCVPDSWPTSFAVTVKTLNTVGSSVVPGTAGKHARAEATSVVGPRCAPAPDGGDAGGKDGADDGRGKDGKGGKDDGGGKGGKGGGKDDPGPAPVTITCDGKEWILDAGDPTHLPDASDLFSVRLAH